MTPQEKQIRNHINKVRETIPANALLFFDRILEHYTMLPIERILDLHFTVTQLCQREVPGDFAEFGVWRGGALGCMAMALNQEPANYFTQMNMNTTANHETDPPDQIDWAVANAQSRKIFGFDTFEGHPEPKDWEVDIHGTNQNKVFHEVMERDGEWAACSVQDVRDNLSSLLGKYPEKLISLIAGDASVTGAEFASSPKNSGLALLRLDMDWYEPTINCLNALGKHVSSGGVIILDDFGHHLGVQEAAEEYFSSIDRLYDVVKIDYSCVRVVFHS